MAGRLDLKLGFSCNNNCRFCVVADKRSRPDKTREEAERDLREARGAGASFLVITGGEPTLQPWLPSLVSLARSLGFDEVQLQTNARMLAYGGLVDELVAAGLTQVVPAIHGHTAALHDHLTRSPGSFEQAVRGLANACRSPLVVITNTVVAKPNYAAAADIARFLAGFGPDSVQFAFVHPAGNARLHADTVVPVISQAARFVAEGLDAAEAAGVRAYYEALPPCLMPGHERQAIELTAVPEEVREPGRTELEHRRRGGDKRQGPRCPACRFRLVCEGVWTEYAERYGFDELVPVPGTPVGREDVLGL